MEGINFNQLEHLQAKYVGTGNPDTTKEEWLATQHKDTYAAFIGHANLVKYVSVATGECSARTKLHHLEAMLIPLRPQTSCEPAYRGSFVDISRAQTHSAPPHPLPPRHQPPASGYTDEEDMDLG